MILTIDRISKAYGDNPPVLRELSLSVRRGEAVAIIGPSGSGKTTALRCVNFLVPYDSGRIHLQGQLVGYREQNGRLVRDTEPRIDAIRRRIGMVFQRFALFPHMTVIDNLIEGPVHVLSQPRDQAVARAEEVLRAVDLVNKRDAFPRQLSGGQQQRVGIARAMCMQPELMLFDEVTSALDPELVDEVLAVIRELARQQMTMLIVTHEMRFAREVADRTVFMEHGSVVADLPTGQFFSHPPSERIASFIGRLDRGAKDFARG